MKYFLDTSVFVAAFWGDHQHHQPSARLVREARRTHAFCAAHTIAEVYSTMTRLPVKPQIPAELALHFVRQIQDQFHAVALTDLEYFATVERLAAIGLAKNYIYDALIMSAAAKSQAEVIYTWNVRHFELVAQTDLVEKIRTP
jgi:predicted nucleic acid-binding protein